MLHSLSGLFLREEAATEAQPLLTLRAMPISYPFLEGVPFRKRASEAPLFASAENVQASRR